MGFDMNQVATASEFLTKEDTDFNGMNLTIRNVTQEEVGQEKDRKFALHFHEPVKAMILNVTNIKILVALFGPDSDGWINQRACIYADPTISFGGQVVVGGLRVRPCQAPPPPPPQQPAPSPSAFPSPQQQQPQQRTIYSPEQQNTIAQAGQVFGSPQQDQVDQQGRPPITTGNDVPF